VEKEEILGPFTMKISSFTREGMLKFEFNHNVTIPSFITAAGNPTHGRSTA